MHVFLFRQRQILSGLASTSFGHQQILKSRKDMAVIRVVPTSEVAGTTERRDWKWKGYHTVRDGFTSKTVQGWGLFPDCNSGNWSHRANSSLGKRCGSKTTKAYSLCALQRSPLAPRAKALIVDLLGKDVRDSCRRNMV